MSALTDAAEVLSAATAILDGRSQDMLSVLLTPADGGPDGDGYVVVSIDGETQVKRPSLAKLLTIVGGTQGRYFMDYAELTATLGEAFGQMATVAAEDPGTHVEPGGTDPVPNPGYYIWTDAATDYWKRVGNLITADIVAALTAAEAARDAILLNPDFIAVSAALDTLASIAAVLDDISTVVANIADIQAAPQAAIDAGVARDEAVAAAAGIPVGAGVLRLTAPPGDNHGQVGEAGYDEVNGVLYTSRSASGWDVGVKLADGSIITRDGQIDDLALGTLPSGITTTRAQSTTGLIAGDTGTAYSTIASGTAVQHPSLGLLSYPQSQQFAPDPTGPSNGTITPTGSFAIGKVIVWLKGNGTLTSSAGTATGSGYGATTEASGVRTITLTTSGTIAFSLAGGDANTLIQIEQSPLFPAASVPTPFMPTSGTRDADRIANTGDLKDALGASEGTIIFDVTVPVNKANNTILGVNTSTGLLQATGDQALQWFDGTNFSAPTTGNGDFRNGCRVGMTWRSGRIAFMGGSRIPTQFAATLLSITAARMGSAAGTSDLYGQASLAGGIQRYQIIDRATVTSGGDALELYDLVSEVKRPSIVDFHNWDAADPLPFFKGRVSQVVAGTITSAPIVVCGPSHEGGVTGFANSWPKVYADELLAAGLPAHSRTFFGTNGSAWTSGSNAHDPRATYTGTAPTRYGKSLGGEITLIPSGGTLTLTFPTAAAKMTIVHTTDTGRGSFTVNAGGGPISPDGGGSSSVSTSAALGMTSKTFSYAGGSTTWTITASGGAVGIAGLFDPTGIPVINGGRSGFTAVDMSNGSLIPESSYLLPMSIISPALIIMGPDNTNSASGAVALNTYRSAVQTQLDYAISIGCDVMVLTDPMSAPELIPEGTQQVYSGIVAREAKRKDLPLFHFRNWSEGYGYAALHKSGLYNEAGITTGLHLSTLSNSWLLAKPITAATLAALGMEQ